MNTVQEIRNRIGMPRRIFAEHLGVSYGAVSNYELGTRQPKLNVCFKIIELAKKYKIKLTLDDILGKKRP